MTVRELLNRVEIQGNRVLVRAYSHEKEMQIAEFLVYSPYAEPFLDKEAKYIYPTGGDSIAIEVDADE